MQSLTAKEAALLIHTSELAATLRQQKDPTSIKLDTLLRAQAKGESEEIAIHAAMKCETAAAAQMVILSSHMSSAMFMQGIHPAFTIPATLLLEFTVSTMGAALTPTVESYVREALSRQTGDTFSKSIDDLQTSMAKLNICSEISQYATKCKLMLIILENKHIMTRLYSMARNKIKPTPEDMASYIVRALKENDLAEITTTDILAHYHAQILDTYYSDFHTHSEPSQEKKAASAAATETTVSLRNTAAEDDEAMRSATDKAHLNALNATSGQLESCNEEELKASAGYRHLQIVDDLLAKVAEDDDGRTALMVAAGDRSNDALRWAAGMMENLGFWSQNTRRVAENTTAIMDEPVEHTENSSVPAID